MRDQMERRKRLAPPIEERDTDAKRRGRESQGRKRGVEREAESTWRSAQCIIRNINSDRL